MSGENPIQKIRGLEVFYVLAVIAVNVIVIVSLIALSLGEKNQGFEESICTAAIYKSFTQPLMEEFERTVEDISLDDKVEIQDAINKLESLLIAVNTIPCRTAYPLEHNNLESAIRQMVDAFNHMHSGNYVQYQLSANESEGYVRQLNDWSIDDGE